MSDRIQWLWRESKGWVARGLITDCQAGQIRGLYPEPKAALPWGTIMFSGIGAGIAGLGIILLIKVSFQEAWWSVVREEQGTADKSSPAKLAELTQAGSWFRLEYRPPDRAACARLPEAGRIWHGRLATRAFSPLGSVD